MSLVIPINPEVLKWAREERGYSLEDIANKFKKKASEIEDWETGKKVPTYVQLERLAYSLYKRPVAIFFFPEPPVEESINNSFRALPTSEIEKISPNLRSIIRKAKSIQISLQELVGSQDQNILREMKFAKGDSPTAAAEKVRIFLGLKKEEQFSWPDSAEALKNWRRFLEGKGVFIFKEAFRDQGFSGFCLHNEDFPIIYLNNSQHKNRQIFTLFHELAHLLLGHSDAEPYSDEYLDDLTEDYRNIEVFCNKFANAFLLPDVLFKKDVKNKIASEELILSLARKYKVSREVISRRMLDENLISENFYKTLVKRWKIEFEKIQRLQKKKSGGNYYNTQGDYFSENYANTVFRMYYQNKISVNEAARYLGVKAKNFGGLETVFSNKKAAL